MVAALRPVKELGTAVRKAAEEDSVPRKTLAKYLLQAVEPSSQYLGRFEPVFSPQQEQELVDHVIKLDRRLYGINCRDLHSLAYQLAEKTEYLIHSTEIPGWLEPIGFEVSGVVTLN